MKFNSIAKSCAFALAACTGLLGGAAIAEDVMPQFTISYFNGPCPEGWDNTALASAEGRILLPTPLGGGVGTFVGDPLASQAAPSHSHSTSESKVTLPSKNFILVAGCCNDNMGKSGTYTMTGPAAAGDSGLPYIQYNACLKSVPPAAGTIPSGLLTYSLLQCSGSFSEFNAAAGRYVVGLNPNGQPAATFGGTNLQPGEIRAHDHALSGSMNFPGKDVAGGSGCCADGYAGAGNHSFTGATVPKPTASDKLDSAVQAPYYAAYLCQAG